MANYRDGRPARVGDQVYGKPEDLDHDVYGTLVGVHEQLPGDHVNAVVLSQELVVPGSFNGPAVLNNPVPFALCKPFSDPAVCVGLVARRAHTGQLTLLESPKKAITVNGREHFVGHRVTGQELKALAGADYRACVRRRSGGPHDPEVGHDQTVEVAPGYEFYTEPS
jgi:hypothetical protein